MSIHSGPANRLAQEASPYLLQHAHNPVDWRPWGTEALADAQRLNKPILLSVGYAACHWCHVMTHESFEDEATAAVMNALFINIKVDREERPDIDQIYMAALHHLGEQGGWPLTMFLTPTGEPVWGGTYFPKDARYGRPAFTDVLQEVARLFREDQKTIDNNRKALMARLAAKPEPEGRVTLTLKDLDKASFQLAQAIDTVNGGLRGAPKFPQCTMFEMLWRTGQRNADQRFLDLVELTLERICEGGIYDHLGGGFSRYSVDEKWLVPHFEKMLYDNAQLLELIALGHQHSGNALYRARATETVDWLAQEMTTKEGAFAASLDADSEGEEGKFYVWSREGIIAILGESDAAYFAQHYDVTAEGNFEGHTILNRLARRSRTAEDDTRLGVLRQRLHEARADRVRPALDDKVLADWNGLMIAALVNAGIVFDEPGWIDRAKHAFAFIAQTMTREDRLGHSWREGRLLLPGLASDYAAMIRAALALFEATGQRPFLDCALTWQKSLDRHYTNSDNGGYFLTADDAEDLVIRPAATTDDAIPNANGLAAQNLVRLALLTGDDAWRHRADRLFDGMLTLASSNLYGHVSLLNALDMRLRMAEIVVTGREINRFADAALKVPFIVRSVLRASSANDLPPNHPAQIKLKAAPETAAFICMGETCSLPVTRPGEIADAVKRMSPRATA